MNRRIYLLLGIPGAIILIAGLVLGIRWYGERQLKEVPVPTQDLSTGESASSETQNLMQKENEALKNVPADTDGEGLYDYEEAEYGTDVNNRDTDGDGFSDFEEVHIRSSDPLVPDAPRERGVVSEPVSESPTGVAPPPQTSLDPDNDGLTTLQEEQIGTDPNNPDTDGDGFSDGDEVQAGYNPLGPGRLQ